MAIKILDKTKLDQKTQRLLSREISSMEKLHHPNIIRLYEVVETLSKLHLVMEYAAGGELFGKISNEGKLSEPESKLIFSQIVSAVKHMVSARGRTWASIYHHPSVPEGFSPTGQTGVPSACLCSRFWPLREHSGTSSYRAASWLLEARRGHPEQPDDTHPLPGHIPLSSPIFLYPES